jgi:hypothetical protein
MLKHNTAMAGGYDDMASDLLEEATTTPTFGTHGVTMREHVG